MAYRLCLICVLVFAASLAGCKSKEAEEPDVDSNTPDPNAVVRVVPPKIVLTVNGVEVSEGVLAKRMDAEMQKMGAPVPEKFLDRYKQELRRKIIDEMTVEILLDQEVETSGIVVTDRDIDKHIRISNARKRISMEDFLEMLEAKGEDINEYRENLRKQLGYEKLMDSMFADSVKISEEDAKKYYSENSDQFQIQEQVRASQILVAVNPGDSDEVKEKAKARAQDLLRHIENGENFSEIAREYSDCLSSSKGGDLGFFAKGAMASVLEEMAFNLEVGQISGIIETEQGLHIVKVTARKAAGIAAYENAERDIMQILVRNRQRELSRQYIEELKRNAKIVYGTAGRKYRGANI
ncbi:MAG: peptidylprolyl isomerase [Sedimentisphaerales bacterium]|nr:peptidylprolyl isomerase [Sedimentisphaerales bacterium]